MIILHPNTVQNTTKYAKSFHILKFSLCFKLKLACFLFFFMFSKELEELRKQGEIIPQLMSECESVSQQLQVQFSNEINFKIVDTFTFFSCSSMLFSVQTSAFEGKRAPVGKTKKC